MNRTLCVKVAPYPETKRYTFYFEGKRSLFSVCAAIFHCLLVSRW